MPFGIVSWHCNFLLESCFIFHISLQANCQHSNLALYRCPGSFYSESHESHDISPLSCVNSILTVFSRSCCGLVIPMLIILFFYFQLSSAWDLWTCLTSCQAFFFPFVVLLCIKCLTSSQAFCFAIVQSAVLYINSVHSLWVYPSYSSYY